MAVHPRGTRKDQRSQRGRSCRRAEHIRLRVAFHVKLLLWDADVEVLALLWLLPFLAGYACPWKRFHVHAFRFLGEARAQLALPGALNELKCPR